MKCYAVIDTNVLVSAMLKYNSVPGTLMEFAFDGLIVPVLNEQIVTEYREVLMREKFHFDRELVEDVISALEEKGEYIDTNYMDYDLPDKNDIVFYAIVMEKRKDEDAYLVTGNIKHFPSKPYVVTPKEMLDILLGDM